MPIYTKKGDKGKTSTFKGPMSKKDQLAVALGTIDELNSWLGMCRYEIFNLKFEIFNQTLKNIQTNLLIIGSSLAGSKLKLKTGETKKLEKLIDKLTEQLPKLSNFIYPVGPLQVARTIARRAEREVVALEIKDKNILKYLNRLSDALFTLARWVNFQSGIKEEVWRG